MRSFFKWLVPSCFLRILQRLKFTVLTLPLGWLVPLSYDKMFNLSTYEVYKLRSEVLLGAWFFQ
jgi:hypothetical protein